MRSDLLADGSFWKNRTVVTLLPLPGDTEVFPGHGDSTTIAREKRSNYFLQRLS